MWLTFPWRPTRKVVFRAVVLTLVTAVFVVLAGVLGPGPWRDITRGLFALLVLVIAIRAINVQVGRVEGEGWKREDNDSSPGL